MNESKMLVIAAVALVGGLCIGEFFRSSEQKDGRLLSSIDRLKDEKGKTECLRAFIAKRKTQVGAKVSPQTGGSINCSC